MPSHQWSEGYKKPSLNSAAEVKPFPMPKLAVHAFSEPHSGWTLELMEDSTELAANYTCIINVWNIDGCH